MMPEEQTEEQQKQGETQGPSNSEIKASPLFQKLTQQIAEFQRKDQEREEQATKVKTEEERKKAEDEGRYSDALKQLNAELEATKAKHSKEILTRDLRLALTQAGFSTRGVDLLATEYNSESHGEPADYAKVCLDNDGNKPFLSTVEQPARVPPQPPGKAPISGETYSAEQLLSYEKSDDPAKRALAYDYLLKYAKEHDGKLPG
jgi:hypothetical protein